MLKTRIVTATILVITFLLALFGLPQKGWIFFCAGILAIASWEWAGLSGLAGFRRYAFTLAVLILGIPIAWGWSAAPDFQDVGIYYLFAIVFWFVAMPPWLNNGLRAGGNALVAAAGFVVLVPCFFSMIHLHALAPVVLLRFMAVVWIADSAAYFSGRYFGRHQLAPSISPGKTWEGIAGALLAVTLYGILWIFSFNWAIPPAVQQTFLGSAAMLIVLWFLALFSICGDLLESALKRRAGVKDSGKLLPGHGGVLDRIDALIPVLPLAAMLFLI